jgi:hypothetical protein
MGALPYGRQHVLPHVAREDCGGAAAVRQRTLARRHQQHVQQPDERQRLRVVLRARLSQDLNQIWSCDVDHDSMRNTAR